MYPETRIGHVHRTVANLELPLSFYRDRLGFAEKAKYGDSALFLSDGKVKTVTKHVDIAVLLVEAE